MGVCGARCYRSPPEAAEQDRPAPRSNTFSTTWKARPSHPRGGAARRDRRNAIANGSARRRAEYNWFILKGLGDRLRDVYEADLGAPLPGQLTKLVDLLVDAASEPARHQVTTAQSGISASPPT